MAGAARQGDTIKGTTDSNHVVIGTSEGHNIYGSSSLSGTISGNCSKNVFINGKAAAFQGSTTSEQDSQDNGSGKVSSGSSKVFINGKSAARKNDKIDPHTGTAQISSGSDDVIIG